MYRDKNRPTGNSQERLEIHSGWVLIIDQFMLGNSQFLSRIREVRAGASDFQGREAQVKETVQAYGGCLLSLPYGTYQVHRAPERSLMFVAPRSETNGSAPGDLLDQVWKQREGSIATGQVFVDTRCLVFVDMELLLDDGTLREYAKLRQRGDDKQARDMLREYGATVRYGFNPRGDELGIYEVTSPRGLALWPDAVDSVVGVSSGDEFELPSESVEN